MKRLLLLLLLAGLAWYGYTRHPELFAARRAPASEARAEDPRPAPPRAAELPAATGYRCDGRIYCSQMTSCAEANFFLKNCPGTKMDGNHDGVPCEQQWCR